MLGLLKNLFNWNTAEQICEYTSDFVCQLTGGQYNLSEYLPSATMDVAETVWESIQEHPVMFGATALIGGVVGMYYLSSMRAKQTEQPLRLSEDHRMLETAIKSRDITTVQKMIASMSTEELNRADVHGNTILQICLKKNRKAAELLIEKFLAEGVAMNTQMANGTSLFQDRNLGNSLLAAVNGRHNAYACMDATRLLDATTGQYRNYACLDAQRFEGNIASTADKKKILARQPVNRQAYNQSAQIQPILGGKFTRKQIAQCATLVDRAKAGVCTTFALAIADKLLTLFPEERIKVIAHSAGANGSHVYVVMNHNADDWKFNDLAHAKTPQERERLSDAAAKDFEKAYVVDPWLASLGWKDGVFGIGSYLKQFQGFLTSAECRYDSGTKRLVARSTSNL